MAEDDSSIKITQFDGKDVIQIDESKMAMYAWVRTQYKGKQYSFLRFNHGTVLMKLDE